MNPNFAGKDSVKFHDLKIEVENNGNIQNLYYHKIIVCNYPKIVGKVKDNIWKISGYTFDIISIFVSDLYQSFKNSLKHNDTIYTIESLIQLHKLASEYDIQPLMTYYLRDFYRFKLTPSIINYFLESENVKPIVDIYLNMHCSEISPDLINRIPQNILNLIFLSDKLDSLMLFWNYCLRFMKTENFEKILCYCYNKKIYADDIKWAVSLSENPDIDDKVKIVIMRYIFKRIYNMNVLQTDHSPIQTPKFEINQHSKMLSLAQAAEQYAKMGEKSIDCAKKRKL